MNIILKHCFLIWTLLILTSCTTAIADDPPANDPLASVLILAGDNRAELETALQQVPVDQAAGMKFLVSHMPQRDLQSLSAEYLLENVRLAYQSRAEDTWARDIPLEVFFNDVLPYASINERRDSWRADFRQQFLPLVKDAKSTSEVTAILNQKIFPMLNVKYSTQRKKADQSPFESIEGGTASCTGLSVLLIDACRAVGVPARMVGTPLWSDNSGNHSWVEIWDDGWQFTGAAEPTGDALNQGWFIDRAAAAQRDNPKYAIYATSFQSTPLSFPCVWDRRINYVPAVNVTDRYVALKTMLPEGSVRCRFVVVDENGKRWSAKLQVFSGEEVLFSGQSNDERFDGNDHLTVVLPKDTTYRVVAGNGNAIASEEFNLTADEQVVRLIAPQTSLATDSSNAQPLTADQIVSARKRLTSERHQKILTERQAEMEAGEITIGDKTLKFFAKEFGTAPAGGHALFISMHGGGGAPARDNDQQYKNQQRLYEPEEGIYVAPRAPTNTWNLWHEGHIDGLFDRLIENCVLTKNVDWNRVYIMGYSAGGDGVYQLAPRMADRWAAAAMMAGHPNETSPLGLRNVPFALQVGGKDAAFKRNEIGEQWKTKLSELRTADPEGYDHFVKIYPEKGHWMDREDAVAIPWMSQRTRNPVPKKIVWKQDDITHSRFYWLGVSEANRKAGSLIEAVVDGQMIDINSSDVDSVIVYLDDRFINLNQPLTIRFNGVEVFTGTVERKLETLAQTLSERADPNLSFPAMLTVSLKKVK